MGIRFCVREMARSAGQARSGQNHQDLTGLGKGGEAEAAGIFVQSRKERQRLNSVVHFPFNSEHRLMAIYL